MTRLLFYSTAIATLAAIVACHRGHYVVASCGAPPRRGTGFERHLIATIDSAPRPLTIRVNSIDRTPGPLPDAVIRWASIDRPRALTGASPSAGDSAVFSLGNVTPGTYSIQITRLGYQRVVDTLVVSPNLGMIEYGLWEEPICLTNRASSSPPAA